MPEPYALLGGGRQPQVRLYHGDVGAVLAQMPAQSVHAIITSPPYWGLRAYLDTGHADKGREIGSEAALDCAGAFTGQPCGACYVCRMVEVGRGLWRILRDDGCFFLNLGDSYAGSGKGFGGADHGKLGAHANGFLPPPSATQAGLKPKDLCGVPWRVALALQAAGWWLRQDIIWSKAAPMPESVQDRCTKSHEYVFLLTRSPRYFFDAVAIRESAVKGAAGSRFDRGKTGVNGAGRVQDGFRDRGVEGGRNKRSVWHLSPEPLRLAHFAAFPPRLVAPCILAGSPTQVCAACGMGYRRVVEREHLGATRGRRPDPHMSCPSGKADNSNTRGMPWVPITTTGFQPACACGPEAGPRASTVLDPFCGSGTTCLVAIQHGRHSLGIDLNAAYLDLAVQRLTPALAQLPLFPMEHAYA